MTLDPFRPILIAGWLAAAAALGYGFLTAPPAQSAAPVQVEVRDGP